MKRPSLVRYAGIGALAGARWSSAPSVLADELRRVYIKPGTSATTRAKPLEWGLKMLARLERYEGEKRSAMIDIAKGAVSAGALAASECRGWTSGIFLGGLAAAVTSVSTPRLRDELGRYLGVDPALLNSAERKVAEAVEAELRARAGTSSDPPPPVIDLDE